MQIEVGSILEGKVTGIIKFGAFVELPDGKSGMVHISEVSNTYVENISDFLEEGQIVKVKVLGINENGKISLSIKKATDNGENNQQKTRQNGDRQPYQKRGKRNFKDDGSDRHSRPSMKSSNSPGDFVWQKTANPTSFEDMMSKFKQQSDEKMSSLKRGNEVTSRRPRRKN